MLAGLALAAVSDLVSVYAGVRHFLEIDGDAGSVTLSQSELDAASSLSDTAVRWQGMVFLPCAIVFVLWFSRMRRATGPLAPDRFRDGPGWAVGGWIVPVVNLWMPYRVAFDMWAASTPVPRDGEDHRLRTWPLNLWWGLFVSAALFKVFGRIEYEKAETLPQLQDSLIWYAAADTLHMLSAPAAAYFAVQLTAMQRHKVSHDPLGTTAAARTPTRSA
ncbi:DUF4328 domain-containing protein [Streptomyces sp. NPDC002328]|uniref:DUF4328 domain-containing protein n=1 Tax=Streptomyces sp. NPDC002328 TaxID=3364642 RepID=UPI003698919B